MNPAGLARAAFLLPILLGVRAEAQTRLTEHTFGLDKPENAAPASLEDLAWLEGRWLGQGFGGVLEETWSAPMAGAVVATFRLVKDDQAQFYEMCWITADGGSLVYKVKHFHPDLKGWEEKDDFVSFPLVKIEKDAAYFNGLTLKREGDVCLHYLAMKQKDGTHQEAALRYERVATATAAEDAAVSEPAVSLELAALEPLFGAWAEDGEAVQPRVDHEYRWTSGGQAIRLRESHRHGTAEGAKLEGMIFWDSESQGIAFVAVANREVQGVFRQGAIFRGEYKVLADGRIERTYSASYPPRSDLPGEELSRRFREVYHVQGNRLSTTIESWHDGSWEPLDSFSYERIHR